KILKIRGELGGNEKNTKMDFGKKI
ncbi:hypothetical protein LCGC14_1527320, partial [marine sediment metagenome]